MRIKKSNKDDIKNFLHYMTETKQDQEKQSSFQHVEKSKIEQNVSEETVRLGENMNCENLQISSIIKDNPTPETVIETGEVVPDVNADLIPRTNSLRENLTAIEFDQTAHQETSGQANTRQAMNNQHAVRDIDVQNTQINSGEIVQVEMAENQSLRGVNNQVQIQQDISHQVKHKNITSGQGDEKANSLLLTIETRHRNSKLLKAFHHNPVDILMQRRIVTACRKIEEDIRKQRRVYLAEKNKQGKVEFEYTSICRRY